MEGMSLASLEALRCPAPSVFCLALSLTLPLTSSWLLGSGLAALGMPLRAAGLSGAEVGVGVGAGV